MPIILNKNLVNTFCKGRSAQKETNASFLMIFCRIINRTKIKIKRKMEGSSPMKRYWKSWK
jgi:hypothetical protein